MQFLVAVRDGAFFVDPDQCVFCFLSPGGLVYADVNREAVLLCALEEALDKFGVFNGFAEL